MDDFLSYRGAEYSSTREKSDMCEAVAPSAVPVHFFLRHPDVGGRDEKAKHAEQRSNELGVSQ